MSQNGTITKWWKDKGYGFVRTNGGTQDIFLHYSVINNALRPDGGEKVTFDIFPDRNTGRPRAINVTINRGNDTLRAMMAQAASGYGGGRQSQVYNDHNQQYRGSNNNYVYGHEYGQGKGHGHHRVHNYKDDHAKKESEEEVLIRFGALLRDGDEAATKIHEEYTTSKDMEAFSAAAAKLVNKRGQAKPTPVQQSKTDQREEERILIGFGEKLQSGDADAKTIHEAYTKDNDYQAFLTKAKQLTS
eukprot:TRINITY_DN47268_c0_g1_i1.p1 TRINITY_DN47268_c0_g1~~TRINITY_DN47268_c0_g1_i1.p1  ORF type:complete len:258 (+),score=78.42 TRINITY_DN47268_c0_g1_i1:40-774(+)